MLPTFPKAQERMSAIWLAAIVAGTRSDQFLSGIPVRVQKEGRTVSFGADELKYTAFSASTSLPSRLGEGLTVQEFYESAEKIGEQMASQQAQMLFEKMSEPSPAGQPFNWSGDVKFDQILELWERMEIRFDGSGRPVWPMIVSNASGQERLKRLLVEAHQDPGSREKWAKLIERKRKAFDESEARRRLAD